MKKFKVIEEGVMTRNSMKSLVGGNCGELGLYGCSNEPGSLVACANYCDPFLNCPEANPPSYSLCEGHKFDLSTKLVQSKLVSTGNFATGSLAKN